MAEVPLLGLPSFVVEPRTDGDDLELIQTVPGPAGSLELRIGSVEVAVDAADVTAINHVRVELGPQGLDPAARRTLTRLLGDALLDEVDHVVLEPPAKSRQIGLARADQRIHVDRVFVRLVTAASATDRPGLLPHERALSVLETVALARRLRLPELVDQWAGDVIDAAALLAADPDHVDRALRNPDARAAAADLCETAAKWPAISLVADGLNRLAAQLRVASPDGTGDGGSAGTRPLDASAQPTEPASVALDSLAPMVTGAWPTVSRTFHDEFEIRLPGWGERAAGWWVRAFSGADGVPVAAVPIEADGDDAVGYCIVPPRFADQLLIDVVDDPSSPRSSERIAAFRAAIATGKRAARLERLDRHDEAAATWQASSELHRRAGDDWRAATALAIADQHYRTTRGGRGQDARPVVTDLVGPGD